MQKNLFPSAFVGSSMNDFSVFCFNENLGLSMIFFFTWLWYRWVISARCQPFKSATEVCWWHAACPFSASHFCSGFLRHFPHKHEKLRIIGYIDLFIICHFLGGICWALLAVEVDNCRWRPASCIALFVTVLVMFIFIMDFCPGKSICFDHLSAEVN